MQTHAPESPTQDDPNFARAALRVLRRMNEPRACLALAQNMEKAVVVRDAKDGRTVRTCVTDRKLAEEMAAKDWIDCKNKGKLARYYISATGRVALRRMIAHEDSARAGFGEGAAAFGDQHREMGARDFPEFGDARMRTRFNMNESPLLTLARRKDKDGNPFLGDKLVAAGERLREDFELAQMGPRITQNWDKFLTGGSKPGITGDSGTGEGSSGARERVLAALGELGPGLGDVVLRCCCFLEGMEAAERRLGWSARSGKIVLRIALQRLEQHYTRKGGWSPLIG